MKWFQPNEYRCRGPQPCNAPKEFDPQLAELLDDLRDRVQRPLIIASGLRCATWNKEQGGEPDSRHLTGRAVDLRVTDPFERWLLLAAILIRPSEEAPFVEVSPHHIHWDLDFRNANKDPMLILGTG